MTISTTSVLEVDRLLSRMSNWRERTTPEGNAKLALIYKRIAYILNASCINNLQMDCR